MFDLQATSRRPFEAGERDHIVGVFCDASGFYDHRRIGKALGLSEGEMAKVLRVRPHRLEVVARSPWFQEHLGRLAEIARDAALIYDRGPARKAWFRQVHPELNCSPLELLKKNEYERVEFALWGRAAHLLTENIELPNGARLRIADFR